MTTFSTLSPSSTFMISPIMKTLKNPTKTLPHFRRSSTLTLSATLSTTPTTTTTTTTTSSLQKPVSDSVQTFWQWLKDEGVVSSKTPVKPAVVPEGLGLVAQKDLARNEVVLEVPKRFWINPDAVAASEIGSVCSGLKPWLSVALFLIREKKKNDTSSWRYYLDVLPDYTNSTIFWSEEELAELQG
nr:ribulose-1,5 bisphosphate carboxylase/oxygenase large subunit n-methyltransferase, chloroplastic [Quercus suber]